MRSWKYFNKEEGLACAKKNLMEQGIFLTKENIDKELENVYAKWLALKINDIVGSNDGADENSLIATLKAMPTKYYPVVLQWLYGEPIHYEGEYFNFEDIYDKAKLGGEEDGSLGISILFESIEYFEKYERKKPNAISTRKYVSDLKNSLQYHIHKKFFSNINNYDYVGKNIKNKGETTKYGFEIYGRFR